MPLGDFFDQPLDPGARITWCDWCTPRKLYHPTDHPQYVPEEAPRMTEPDCTWCGEPGAHLGCAAARIQALATSTHRYAESLSLSGDRFNADMANVYSGKALGLEQAARMLRTEAGL